MAAKSDNKSKALELAISQVDKQFGTGSIMRLGNEQPVMSTNSISTGCLSLDVALGIGGIPKGRVIEIYGPESSGKTTLALHIVAEAQKAGGYAAFVDAEPRPPCTGIFFFIETFKLILFDLRETEFIIFLIIQSL